MKFSWVLALGAAAFLTVPSEAGDWKLSLAASYRSFDDVTFSPIQLSSSGGEYVNGYYNSDSDYLVLGESQMDPGGWQAGPGDTYIRNVSFDQTNFSGAKDGWGGTAGSVISVSRQLATTDSGWTFGANISLGWFSADLRTLATEGNGLMTTAYVGYFSIPQVLPDPPPNTYPTAPVSGAAGPGLTMTDTTTSATTTASLEMDADLDLYVLSLGLQASRAMGPVSVRLEAGPTLNFADFDTSMTQSVSWISGDGSVYSPASDTDDTFDVLFGAYASGALSWHLTEQIEIGLEARWDEVFDDVSTDLAAMDLSGLSFSAIVGFSF
jgi:hypothetical protein